MSAEAKTPASPQSKSIFNVYDFVPVLALILLVVGFLMYKDAAPNSTRLLWGKQIFMPLGNFVLFLYLLLSKVLPGLKQSLVERHLAIVEGVQEFDDSSDTIQDRYQDIREKLAQVDEETQAILEQATHKATQEKEALITEAESQAKRVVESAGALAQYEKHRIRQELQHELIERSFARAEELLKQHISDQDQANLQSEQLTLVAKIS